MTVSDGVESGVNSLLPKLQTKLVVLPGAINTHQLHRHYSNHNATANRLLQRLATPEQLTARYTAGLLPTKAIQGRYQRYQRTESLAGGESLVNVSVVQRSTGNDSGWQQDEQIRTPAGEESTSTQYFKSVTSPSITNNPPSPTPPGTYRISRQPNLTFNSPPGSISVTTDAGNVDSTTTNSESAPVNSGTLTSPNVTANANSTDALTPNPTASSIQLKMPPQADNHHEAKAINNTKYFGNVQRKYGHPEGLQSASESIPRVLYRVAHKRVENSTPTVPSSSNDAEELGSSANYSSDSNLGLNSPVTTNPSQSSASSIQLKMQPQADNHPEVKVVTTTHTPATIQ